MSISSRSNGTWLRTRLSTRRALSQRWQPGAKKSSTLWIEPTRRRRLGHPSNRDRVGRLPHGKGTLLVPAPGLRKRPRDDVVQLRVHLGLLPEVLLEPLHPLEIRDDDPAGVREHVRKNEDASVFEDQVR